MEKYIYNVIFITIIGIRTVVWSQIDSNIANSYTSVNIPEVALIDIESTTGSNNINITMNRTYEAGKGSLGWWEDDTLWMNYSSVTGSSEPTREITAVITSGETPQGTKLELRANQYSSLSNEGSGSFGTPTTTRISLSETPQAIITDIGSSYTGDGPENGHQLIYRIAKKGKSYTADIRAGNYAPITITYTMTDN